MSSAYANPLVIELRASPRLAAVIVAMHAGAIAAVAVLPWPMTVRVFVGSLLAIHAGYAVLLYAIPYLPVAITALRVDDSGCSWRRRRSATWETLRVANVFVHPLTIVLVAKTARGRRDTLVVLSDRLSIADFSRLRVRLEAARAVGDDRA